MTEVLPGPARLPVLPPFPGRPGRRRPLPDAIAVHRIPLPEPGPPYDDARTNRDNGADRATADRERPAVAGPHSLAADGGPRRPTVTAGEWPGQFAQALAETLAGARSSQQLTPWTTQQARRRIRQLGPLLKAEQRPRVRRVLTSAPASDVVEMTVIVGVGPRIRAMAVRLERADPARERPGRGRPWLCTAIEAA